MIFLESPTNPLIKVVDVKSIADHAHKANRDIVVVFDNTMMSPVLMTPLDLGLISNMNRQLSTSMDTTISWLG